jgi:glycosyltransferase involved in cell wall biosynthesis
VHALVVTNMWPTPQAPQRGIFVRDQVTALRARSDVDVDVFAFRMGPRGMLRALADVRRFAAGRTYDVVHAHFGLAALPALASRAGPVVVTLHGNDLFHPRSRAITRALLPFCALTAAVSRAFAGNLPGAGTTREVAVLPVGIAFDRFRPIPRRVARAHLGLDPDAPFLLFPHDPSRASKGVERAREAAGDVPLRTLGSTPPDEVPYWINAANAVLVPSLDEGFGLSVIEALACDVPVLATPVGIHPLALEGVDGVLCAPWDAGVWQAFLAPLVAAPDPRIAGRARAALFSSDRLAGRVAAAWDALAGRPLAATGTARVPAYTRATGGPCDQAPARP